MRQILRGGLRRKGGASAVPLAAANLVAILFGDVNNGEKASLTEMAKTARRTVMHFMLNNTLKQCNAQDSQDVRVLGVKTS
jgi:hypothetical protein